MYGAVQHTDGQSGRVTPETLINLYVIPIMETEAKENYITNAVFGPLTS